MIKSFRHKGLEQLYERGDSSKLPPHHAKRLRTILALLDRAKEIRDMNFPGSGLHRLKGKMKAFWAVTVSGNYRIIFRFEGGDAYDVDYLDYH